MNARRLAACTLVLGIATHAIHGSAQQRPDPAALIEEMTFTRVGDSDWPAAGAVAPK